MYTDVKHFNQVPADELVVLGVQDVLRTPGDGVDRNTWISWNTAKLAVAASFKNMGNGEKPCHRIVVENADERGNSIAFFTETLGDGTVRVATVSGWHPEGRAQLNPTQADAFKALVDASIASGEKQ